EQPKDMDGNTESGLSRGLRAKIVGCHEVEPMSSQLVKIRVEGHKKELSPSIFTPNNK
ncbi:hypothetical protein SARC_15080, partial [Sphaeroforma arctica JP610]